MIPAGSLRLMQDGFRLPPETMRKMVEYVQAGGRYDRPSLEKHNPRRIAPIAIVEFEDGARYVRDGFHRVMSIFVGRPNRSIDEDECVIDHKKYQGYLTPKLEMGFFTPFDPRTEVRAADFGAYRRQVLDMIEAGENPIAFILSHRHVYIRPRRPLHDTVQVFALEWFKENEIFSATSDPLADIGDIEAINATN